MTYEALYRKSNTSPRNPSELAQAMAEQEQAAVPAGVADDAAVPADDAAVPADEAADEADEAADDDAQPAKKVKPFFCFKIICNL